MQCNCPSSPDIQIENNVNGLEVNWIFTGILLVIKSMTLGAAYLAAL